MRHKQVDYVFQIDLPTKTKEMISMELLKKEQKKQKALPMGDFAFVLACSSDKFNFPLER